MTLSIRNIVTKILAGSIRIPAFQRGFVWDAELVAHLMDSIYKNYPFGAVILWRTKEQLNAERTLGPFELPKREPDFPIDYVLDGQQRLTSVFGVFQSEIEPAQQSDWMQIYFDMHAQSNLQESQFVALHQDKIDPNRHFPIGTFFDVAEYRRATSGLSNADAETIDNTQAIFKEAEIPVQYIETDNRAKVGIVFERVNRLGVELDNFQLLSAWTWSEEFDLRQRFEELSEELKPFGFEDVGEDTNLLLRCCAAVVANDASPGTLIGLSGAEVRNRFGEIEAGVRGAIDFLRRNLYIQQLRNLPYSTLLVPLCAYFATPGGRSAKLTESHRQTLVRWFWRACFSRRYSAGVLRSLNRDIVEAIALRDGTQSSLSDFGAVVDEDFFLGSTFNVNTVHTRTMIPLLAQQQPLSFVSGTPVDLARVLEMYNRNEFHHLYPRAYLKAQGFENKQLGCLANFAFMSGQDNKTLGAAAPSEYRRNMNEQALDNILRRSLCPKSLFDDNFDTFMSERAGCLVAQANFLIK